MFGPQQPVAGFQHLFLQLPRSDVGGTQVIMARHPKTQRSLFNAGKRAGYEMPGVNDFRCKLTVPADVINRNPAGKYLNYGGASTNRLRIIAEEEPDGAADQSVHPPGFRPRSLTQTQRIDLIEGEST
jgi:hypothetical protein